MTVPDPGEDAEARARALALLEATHSFPCAYSFTVIGHSGTLGVDAVERAAMPDEVARAGAKIVHETKESAQGRYVSHRLQVPVQQATDVLEIYARFRALAGVVTVL